MKKVYVFVFLIVLALVGICFLSFDYLDLLLNSDFDSKGKLSQDFTEQSLDILTKTYKYKDIVRKADLYELKGGLEYGEEPEDMKTWFSFSKMLENFPHLKLKDGYDLKYFIVKDISGPMVVDCALKREQSVITQRQRYCGSSIAAIQLTENTIQAKQELAVFQMVLDTFFWSNDVLFKKIHKLKVLAAQIGADVNAPTFSPEEKKILKKAYVTPTYEETSDGFKIRFLLFHDFGQACLEYITYEFIRNEKGVWQSVKKDPETLFCQEVRYFI